MAKVEKMLSVIVDVYMLINRVEQGRILKEIRLVTEKKVIKNNLQRMHVL